MSQGGYSMKNLDRAAQILLVRSLSRKLFYFALRCWQVAKREPKESSFPGFFCLLLSVNSVRLVCLFLSQRPLFKFWNWTINSWVVSCTFCKNKHDCCSELVFILLLNKMVMTSMHSIKVLLSPNKIVTDLFRNLQAWPYYSNFFIY